jgi:hypothetical protein
MTTGVTLVDDAMQTPAAIAGFLAGYCAARAAATPRAACRASGAACRSMWWKVAYELAPRAAGVRGYLAGGLLARDEAP